MPNPQPRLLDETPPDVYPPEKPLQPEVTAVANPTPLSTEKVWPDNFEQLPTPEPTATPVNSAELQVENYLNIHFSYIRERVNAALRYPLMARKQGWSGQVRVEFTILASGRIADLKIVESSGHRVLDRQALRAVESANPFPPPPVVATITLPVNFELN